MISRIMRIAMKANARRRDREYVTSILRGPDTTFRSELIEVMSNTR